LEENKMEYIYAAMILHKAGKDVDEAGIKKVLEAAAVKVDEARVKALVAALDGVNIEEAIKSQAVMAPAASAPAAAAPEAAKEAPKEEKKAPEAAAAGLGSLFG
jgi:large subunit ribosomal protein L12